MGKNILLISDLPGYGKVALAAAMPVLSHLGHYIYNLPTALVSNTLDYGKFKIQNTTDYMRGTIEVWEDLGFTFDAISTGFIVSEEQAQLVASYCLEQKQHGSLVFSDPIMGDEGHLYNGITEHTVEHMRKLVAASDYTTPNYTEAAYLTGLPYHPEGMTQEEAQELMGAFRHLTDGSIIVTSARLRDSEQIRDVVLCYDAKTWEEFMIPFQSIPVRFPGTGDLFSSILAGMLLDGHSLRESTRLAMDTVKTLIQLNLDNQDKFRGIHIESSLPVIDRILGR